MASKMLIDATHPEETRVVVLRGNRVEEFDFESAQRRQLRGNIYLAKVTRVEPSLQAAFVDYGGNRHGFLAFSEIHPDYYQIPVADRQALLDEERRAHRAADDEDDRRHRRHRSRPAATGEDTVKSAAADEGEDQDDREDQYGRSESPPADEAERAADEAEHEPASEPPARTLAETDYQSDTPALADAAQSSEDVAFSPEADETDARVANEGVDIEAPGTGAEMATSPEMTPWSATEASTESAENGNSAGDIEEVDTEEAEEEVVESVGGGDAMEEVPERMPRLRRQYKIQEVIKRRQIMLVQVVKEERGTKGAALTTYLSLAGRYSVLMPNTARGGGISRKITNAQDRKRLKEIAHELEVPEGMGVILRTAGANRTKTEIKRDFEYLLRLWETVRDLTLQSMAPKLVYEEGSLIKRAIRDLYSKEIDEILTAGDDAYKEAKDFMRMLMPSHAKNVKPYKDTQPIFTRFAIESQLDAMFSPVVQLRSGGYIVLNQTEALVAIDVNSGRATREHHIEDTALKTNLEASEEISRQLRLRDLAGLIVIDFIDMDEKRNNRAVERRLKECLRHDRARIQVGRISHFGLLEMSRQRIRSSVLESSTEKCPHCGGTGHVRSVASVALQLVRSLEEMLLKGATHNLIVRTRAEVALYVLNQKRAHLRELEQRFRLTLSIQADETVGGTLPFSIERGEQVHSLEAAKALVIQPTSVVPMEEDEDVDVVAEDVLEEREERAAEGGEGGSDHEGEDEEGGEAGARTEDGQRRRRRRRRRGRREPGSEQPLGASADAEVPEQSEPAAEPVPAESSEAAESRREAERRRRRRGRRGGRRGREREDQPIENGSVHRFEAELTGAVTDVDVTPPLPKRVEQDTAEPQPYTVEAQPYTAEPQPYYVGEPATPEPAAPEPAASETPARAEEAPPAPPPERPRRRSTVREPAPILSAVQSEVSAPATPLPVPQPAVAAEPTVTPPPLPASEERTAEAEPPKSGWWKRRLFGNS